MTVTAADAAPVRPWHALEEATAEAALGCGPSGLSTADAEARLARWGPNRLEPTPPTPLWRILVRQFANPLIYILLLAAVVSVLVHEYSDAGFIAAVLILNAVIGGFSEGRAERRVRSLAALMHGRARVRRGGRTLDIDAEAVVPGDLMLLESGIRVAADLRLTEAQGLRVDESLLTGESVAVEKDVAPLPEDTPLADRRNMAFAGCMVASGRGEGVVVATGEATEVGSIARQMAAVEPQPPPLILRMQRFARVIGVATLVVAALLVLVGRVRGQPFDELLMAAIALAVSAVPEGLPVALTVALAVAVSRMASRGVLVRHLPAVEALGSCGVIATDKTGTLTRNELTVEVVVAEGVRYQATGVGYAPDGELRVDGDPALPEERPELYRLLRAGVLANEATLLPGDDGGEWEWSGDPTDVALLSVAVKAGVVLSDVRQSRPEVGALPFEPERRYAASYHATDGAGLVCVKGAPERVLEMCSVAPGEAGGTAPDPKAVLGDAAALMREGYRVLALAEGELDTAPSPGGPLPDPAGLRFLGLVGMTDPPRTGVEEAVRRCHRAGIRVVMITGDHAVTALTIASRIGLAGEEDRALEGHEVEQLDDDALAARVADHAVVARATPADKIRIVRAWQRRGDYVAVTGDGVNDAPALRQANLGVAMGLGGTDVAREAAELVITDDNFASIVAGIEEGRVAYDNVRKVTYLLVSTGAGEVLLVVTAVALGLPVPLTAAQLLWLNLVTNGIQDVALAFEPGEEGVLDRPPRPTRERIFNRIMIERTLLAAVVMGGVGLAAFAWLMSMGMPLPEARNLLVQLFVLFEVFHIGNARSETLSVFRLNPLRNRFLLAGTGLAVAVHLTALQIPFFQRLLGVTPISLAEWAALGSGAVVILLVMEAHKRWRPVRTDDDGHRHLSWGPSPQN